MSKKIADYSKSVLVEFISSQFSFTGEELYAKLDRIEYLQKWQALETRYKAVDAQMRELIGKPDKLSEYVRLMDEDQKILDEIEALTKQP